VISIADEKLIPLRDAPKHLPPRPNGKRLHISVFYRWISRGVRGVLLESIRIGGTTYTSLQALQRFGVHLSPVPTGSLPQIQTPFARRREAEGASRRVAIKLGLPTQPDGTIASPSRQ
jgi:hypothetical protein